LDVFYMTARAESLAATSGRRHFHRLCFIGNSVAQVQLRRRAASGENEVKNDASRQGSESIRAGSAAATSDGTIACSLPIG